MLAPEALGQAPPHCSPAAAPARADDPPLVVDLDGTLLRTDSLVESLFVLAKRRPASLLALPCALRRGRAAFKRWVAVRARPELETLPFDEPMMDLLRAEKRRGRRLVLATGADQLLAQAIADRLDLFDEVLASDGRRNLAGQVKAERLVAAYGARGFDYAGNARRDRPVWARARRAILVGDAARSIGNVEGARAVDRPFLADAPDRAQRAGLWLRELRCHHWIKNVLVLLPLVLAHRVLEPAALAASLAAAFAFCLAASSIYVLNDLFDLPADRRHPRKRARPIASGRVPMSQALAAVPLLWIGAGAVAAALHPGATSLLGAYVAGMLAYSLRLRDMRWIDAAVLGGGYTLRVMLGALVIGQGVDPWLAAWCAPTFFGFALLKRRAELACATARDPQAHVRGYRPTDGRALESVGRAAGWVGIAVLASMSVVFANPLAVSAGRWAGCALIAAWTHRMWRLAVRGRIDDDPVVFTLHDRASHLFGAALVAVFLATP